MPPCQPDEYPLCIAKYFHPFGAEWRPGCPEDPNPYFT